MVIKTKTMILKKKYVIIRNFGLTDWRNTFNKMNEFTNTRHKNTLDEIWCVEHYPIFTRGYIEHNKNILYIKNIPVVQSNRGGKITYHGPGQQIIYLLLNLRRLKMNIKKLLFLIEKIVLSTLYEFSIFAYNDILQPGIFVYNKKICSIGLRIQNGCCLHGFALNINMNLTPFTYINPCGDSNILMTKISDIKKNISLNLVQKILIKKILLFFNMNGIFSSSI